MKFSADVRPPTHCLLQRSAAANNCSCFPIQLDQDVRTVGYIKHCTTAANLFLSIIILVVKIEDYGNRLNCTLTESNKKYTAKKLSLIHI